MPIVESTFAALPRDPRLEVQVADHATSAAPAWLWRADGIADPMGQRRWGRDFWR